MSICNCCLSHTGFIVITDFVKLNYNFYFLCVCVYVCASLWFDNLYGDLVTFVSLRPFHLLYPLSLSSMETFIQSLFAFPLGESLFVAICRIAHPLLTIFVIVKYEVLVCPSFQVSPCQMSIWTDWV